jgi:CRISPR-associated protein Cas5t
MVNYRREMSYGYVQSYPLPTPSMVKGMAHALLDLREYHNLKLSIQGEYDTIITNMQTANKFDRVRKGRENPLLIDVIVGGKKHFIKGNMFVDLIVNMKLVLHIKLDEDELNDRLYDELQRQTIILGRNEDIARVDEVKMVEYDVADKFKDMKYNIFFNRDLAKSNNFTGVEYRLPFYYQDVKSYQDKRIFKFVDATYLTKEKVEGVKIRKGNILVDEDNDLISFLEVDFDD